MALPTTSWGRFPVINAERRYSQREYPEPFSGSTIARGLGRSYGDSALAEQLTDTTRMDRFIRFDESSGVLTCDAGVSLDAVLKTFVPKGWFLPVTPGTKFITVGGAIASDVHGKNHHLDGSFCDHLLSLRLSVHQQEYQCSETENPDLFRATCGGMGLTGVITEATFKLKPIGNTSICQTTYKAKNLEHLLSLFEQHQNCTYSVAWVDCLAKGAQLGRSLLMLGEHAQDGTLNVHRDSRITIPLNLPSFTLNRFSVGAFNQLYYARALRSKSVQHCHYDAFFYPLDSIGNWNRIYGRAGFTQYQFVLPLEGGKEGLKRILTEIASSQLGSFLAVLKVFGRANQNLLSFPAPGYTLALDFKLSQATLDLLDRLDEIVREYQGRLYLSKDMRMSESMFKQGYPQWEKFQQIREEYGAKPLYNSLQSARIGL